MSAAATTARAGLPPFYRRRGFWRNAVPVIAAAAAFFVGVGLFTALHSNSHVKRIKLPPTPATPPTVKLQPADARAIHALVHRFIFTAVAHKHLAESYKLIGPGLRENLSLKQWTGGQTTVQPYPVDAKTTLAFEKPDWVHPGSVRLQVHVITPDKPNQTKLMGTETFYVDVTKAHGRWVVNNWVPRWMPPILNPNG